MATSKKSTAVPFNLGTFMKSGGLILLLFIGIFTIAKVYQGSDRKYEVKEQTHYQDGIDRVVVCEPPSNNFQNTPAIGWIVGVLALAALGYLIYLISINRAPDWFDGRSVQITLATMVVVLVFMFVISKGRSVDCVTVEKQVYEKALQDDNLKGLFKK